MSHKSHVFGAVQESGPFTKWHHRHHILDDGGNGTILRDEVESELPLGPLVRWLAGWFVRRRLENMCAFRDDAIAGVCENAPHPAG